MEIAELKIDIEVYNGLTLKKGYEYVMSGAVMAQLSKLYPGAVVQSADFDNFYNKIDFYKIRDGEKLFLFRSGGIGDIMFMLPLIKLIKNYTRNVEIKVATSPMYIDVLKNNPFIDKAIQMPFRRSELEKSDKHLIFEGVIEHKKEMSQVMHAVDLFLSEANVNYKEISANWKVPEIYLLDKEISKIKGEISKMRIDKNLKKVGIQIEASSPIRTFPFEKNVDLINRLLDSGFSVFIFGSKRQEESGKYLNEIMAGRDNFVNLILPGKTLRDSIVYTSLMDIFVAPDSAFVHIAGALGIPIVGLYGCFPSLLRMKYYKNSVGIDCGVVCAPSFIHGHSACVRGFPSPCFSVVSVDDIMNSINHLLKNKDIKKIYPTYNEFIDGELIESPFNDLVR